jgi:hypothetical protein
VQFLPSASRQQTCRVLNPLRHRPNGLPGSSWERGSSLSLHPAPRFPSVKQYPVLFAAFWWVNPPSIANVIAARTVWRAARSQAVGLSLWLVRNLVLSSGRGVGELRHLVGHLGHRRARCSNLCKCSQSSFDNRLVHFFPFSPLGALLSVTSVTSQCSCGFRAFLLSVTWLFCDGW